ncbi:MAG: cytosolic protein [Planctomycetes bacterium]|nr:cytosolic protein [Planctomycetota bacterium]
MATARSDQDTAWKEILEGCLPQFLAFFFPEIHADIDWSREPQFLNKELAKIHRRGEVGKRVVDTLVRVWLRGGEEAWILIHVEIQGYQDPNFEERVDTCNHRIFERFRREVVSLAVLTDSSDTYRPCRYERRRWTFRHLLEFPAVKLLDWRPRWADLERDPNPFALVVMAHLKLLEARSGEERLGAKVFLLRKLLERGHSREDIIHLLRFIDWLVALPDDLEDEFERNLDELHLESAMPYVTSWERRAERKGREEGLKEGLDRGFGEGLMEAIELGLELRFGKPGLEILPRVREVKDVGKLRELKAAVREHADLQGFKAALERILAG